MYSFDLKRRVLELNPKINDDLRPPRTSTPELTFTGWRPFGREPKLNGVNLPLEEDERSLSIAISHDGEMFMHGGTRYLRLYDRNGVQIWRQRFRASRLNMAANGKVAIAVHGGGTIRWYRVKDGQELLAFFPHPDKKRWVLWTPSGYYDAAAGAEDLLGWHVNQGPDKEALFYSVAQFRDRLYRPDVIARVLDTLDVRTALEQADLVRREVTTPVEPLQKVLPPVVELVSPREGIQVTDTDLLVTFLLQSPSGDPVTELQGLVDGRVVTIRPNPLSRGQDELKGKLILPIPPQNVTIGLRAQNRHGTSAVATAQVNWVGLATARPSPNLYVLAIGVGSYPPASDIESLDFPAKGARELATLLENQAGGLYEKVVTRVLLDGEATQDAIFDGLDWLEEMTQSTDVAMLFLAGHGVKSKKGQYHFLPFDANLTRLRRTSVRGLELQGTLSRIRGRAALFFDTAYSGQVLDFPGAKVLNPSQVNVDEVANVLAQSESGPIVFASSTGQQLSLENKELENGVFAAGLLEGLAGAADSNRDGFIMASELAHYVAQRVADLTNGKQTPTTTYPKGLPDLTIAQVTP